MDSHLIIIKIKLILAWLIKFRFLIHTQKQINLFHRFYNLTLIRLSNLLLYHNYLHHSNYRHINYDLHINIHFSLQLINIILPILFRSHQFNQQILIVLLIMHIYLHNCTYNKHLLLLLFLLFLLLHRLYSLHLKIQFNLLTYHHIHMD